MAISASWSASGTTVTFTTASNHNLQVNDIIVISNTNYTSIDGYRTIASVPSSTTFTVTIASTTASGSSASIILPSDITEEFSYDLSSQVSSAIEVTGDQSIYYDIEVGGIGFIVNPNPQNPYRRQTAQYRKDQQDNSIEPGEQSLTGWWLRSQSSFHLGAGIKFYEPAQELGNAAQNQTLRFQFEDSQGVDVWTNGQVSLLKNTANVLNTSGVNCMVAGATTLVVGDGTALKKVTVSGDTGSSVTLTGTHSSNFKSVTTDGVNYWASCGSHIHRGSLTGGASSDVSIYTNATASTSVVAYEKQYLLAGINQSIYVLDQNQTTGTTLPTVTTPATTGYILYSSPNGSWAWTSFTSNGSVIYAAGYSGSSSKIYKITIDPDTLNLDQPIIVAELPAGEIVYSIKSYLGYVLIGTSKGFRVAQVTSDAGDIIYGPLVVQTPHDVTDIAVYENYVWITGGDSCLYRIDLSSDLGALFFPYAKDLAAGSNATSFVSVLGTRIVFSVDGAGLYVEKESEYVSSGYLTTGRIRFNTLESKLFKFVSERASYATNTTIKISTIDKAGNVEDLGTSNPAANGSDYTVFPASAQEFLQFKFTLYRGNVNTTYYTPTFYGYQVKALPAAKRQRLIQYPVFNYDTETDKYNNAFGYEDRAYAVLSELELMEERGDVVVVKDFRSGEQFNALIEELSYTGTTSPDKKFSGFGGEMLITVRKI